jgi:hypothetical protein
MRVSQPIEEHREELTHVMATLIGLFEKYPELKIKIDMYGEDDKHISDAVGIDIRIDTDYIEFQSPAIKIGALREAHNKLLMGVQQ